MVNDFYPQFSESDKYDRDVKFQAWKSKIENIVEYQTPEEKNEYFQYAINFMEQAYAVHKLSCQGGITCPINISFEKRIDFCNAQIRNLPQTDTSTTIEIQPVKSNTNPEYTTTRQVLALYYMVEALNIEMPFINKTDLARFTQFITGKEANNSKIQNTNIYKKWNNILSKSDKGNYQDLEYIKGYFAKLGLSDVVQKIDNDLDSFES